MMRSSLLPEIFFDESVDSSGLELFQNQHLRAILKYQNDYLNLLVLDCCKQMNPNLSNLPQKERNRFIRQTIQNNQALRNQCVGLIVSFLELDQFTWYLNHKTDCNKRILQMVEKRVLKD
ncbi:hypothetical protein Fluta_4046 [Fluviicola taffensis DSM 16823]|uniref:Glyoxalase n=2 Tax=Fluviicola TaxID=332102 RepID=F2IIP6_FLUTR|nr:hypothetical protein Fluta_4046 [Fluviicola taffensis DSM 16823]